MKDIKIPFDLVGNQLSYPRGWDMRWKDNYTFQETLTLDHTERGRSSVSFVLKDSTGNKYSMFLSDFEDMIKKKEMNNGVVFGEFCFCKKGMNYGLKLVQ